MSYQIEPRSIMKPTLGLVAQGQKRHDTYGTFRKGGVRARLFEVDTYGDSLRFYCQLYTIMAVIAILIWPVGWILAIPAWMYGSKSNDKITSMFAIFCICGSVIGFAFSVVPFAPLPWRGGPEMLEDAIRKKLIVPLDIVDFFTSELMLLFCMVFNLVYNEYYQDLRREKAELDRQWQTCERGVLQQTTWSVSDVLRKVKTLPGWARDHCQDEDDEEDEESNAISKSHSVAHSVSAADICGQSRGVFAMLNSLRDEAEEKAVLALDLYIARDQWEIAPGMTLWKGLYLMWGQTETMLMEMKLYYEERYFAGVTLFILAAVRSILSRFWLRFHLQGTFFPTQDPYLAALVSLSVLTTFVTGWFWMMLVYKVLIQYRFTLAQVIILTAIADPDKRMAYSETILQGAMWYGLTPDECVAHMRNMPLLDLRIAGNAETFWDMRDYVMLDRSSETLACSMLLEITVLWLVIKVGITMHTVFTSHTIPAMMSVTIFDLLTFGVLLIVVMQASIQINGLLDKHAQMLTEAKFSVSMHIATKQDRVDKKSKKETASSQLARKLLFGQLEMCKEYESRDKILFGSTVTPGKLLTFAFMGASSVVSMLEEMVAKGSIKVL